MKRRCRDVKGTSSSAMWMSNDVYAIKRRQLQTENSESHEWKSFEIRMQVQAFRAIQEF